MKPAVILPAIQRSAMDCGLCCVQMLAPNKADAAREFALKTVPDLHENGMSVREVLGVARHVGLTLRCRPRPLELTDDDVGLMFIKIPRGLHYVVWFEGVIVNPADGQVWNPSVYLATKKAKVKSAYAVVEAE